MQRDCAPCPLCVVVHGTVLLMSLFLARHVAYVIKNINNPRRRCVMITFVIRSYTWIATNYNLYDSWEICGKGGLVMGMALAFLMVRNL